VGAEKSKKSTPIQNANGSGKKRDQLNNTVTADVSQFTTSKNLETNITTQNPLGKRVKQIEIEFDKNAVAKTL
jgi:hypothetical protein